MDDRVFGLDSKAGDYLVMPFAFPESLARLRALLRRGRQEPAAILKVGNLAVALSSRTVSRNADKLDLISREFGPLKYLLRDQGCEINTPLGSLASSIDRPHACVCVTAA